MVNLPLGMVSFLIYKMDLEFLENGLDPNAQYAGLSYTEFIREISAAFDHFKSIGDDRLTYILGTIEGSSNRVLGFESPNSGAFFPFVFESADDVNIIAVHRKDTFTKVKNSKIEF